MGEREVRGKEVKSQQDGSQKERTEQELDRGRKDDKEKTASLTILSKEAGERKWQERKGEEATRAGGTEKRTGKDETT
eukprot:8294922-Pyramimonas_sp.AAC.1